MHEMTLEQEVRVLRLKCASSLSNNLCSDHRDKQGGKPCLACTIERLEAKLSRLATPAQTVDVEAVKTLLELVEGEHGGDHTEADCRHCVAFNKLSQAIGDKT